MKNLNLLKLAFLSLVFVGCENEEKNPPFVIEGITMENYPKVDGSTSTQPLNLLIACKLLGVNYNWQPGVVGEWRLYPEINQDFFVNRVKVSQTHGAFMNLIDKNADLILTHRTISSDEKAHAKEVGVTLIETPIALDAFDFVVNKENPVKSLTVNQVQDIYTGKITNWKQVGGNDEIINPFVRPRNSGSQEVMESLVMPGMKITDLPEISEIASMAGVFPEITHSISSLCYTFDYYKQVMVRVSDESVPKLAINGIFPDQKSVKNRTYPFVAEVHVAIRSDLDKNSMAYKIYKLLLSASGKDVINESGYIAN